MKGLPKSFFEKVRPQKSDNTREDRDKIVPFLWSKEVLSGRKQVVVSLPSQK